MKKSINLTTICLVATMSLTACVATPPVEEDKEITQADPIETETPAVETIPDLPLTKELMYYILGAEMAEQRGNMSLAADMYHEASKLVKSQSVARRSAGIATQTHNLDIVDRAMARWVALEPGSADAQMVSTSVLISQNKLEQAQIALEKALQLRPEKKSDDFAEITSLLANTEGIDAEAALGFIAGLAAFKRQDLDALFAYARLAAYFKKFDLALPIVDKILAAGSQVEGAALLKSDILDSQGNKEESLAVLAKASKNADVSDNLLQAYAQALVSNGKHEQATKLLRSLYEKNPENEQVILTLGLLAMDVQEYKQAKSYFSEALKLGDSGQKASYFMGLATEENQELTEALTWFSAVSPESRHYYAAQGRYVNILADQGKLHEARQHFKLLRTEIPAAAAGFYDYEATFLREHGQDQAAFEVYTEALAEFPDNTGLLYGRAMVSEPLNKLDVLESDLKKVLKLEPKNADALNALGYTLADKTERYEEAKGLISRALAVRPEDPFFLDSMGWVHYRLGNLTEAVLYLQRAVDLKPDAEMLAHLGEVLWVKGDKEAAKKVWQQAREKDPENSLLKETLQRLQH